MKLEDITIRTTLKPGDLGFIMYCHGKFYGDAHNYGVDFELYVAKGLCEFYENYDTNLDRVWVCEYQNKIVGFIMLMHRGNSVAQLRYFYLDPACRGLGLGKKLMTLFVIFLKEKKYTSCHLWTANGLDAAAGMYKKFGFIMTEEKETTTFGKQVTEQRYDLFLEG